MTLRSRIRGLFELPFQGLTTSMAFVPNKLEAMEFKVLGGCQDFLTCQQVDNLRGGHVVGGAS